MLVKVEWKKEKLSPFAGEHKVQSANEPPGKTKHQT